MYRVTDGHYSLSSSEERRVVMLGKTGSGKSSLANTIFGEELFKIAHSLTSETGSCNRETKSIDGKSITLIDTPGFFHTDTSEEELKNEIVRCITECAPGPHAFLIVVKVESFTEHVQDVINKIQEYFSEEAFKHATVVFTHGDQLPEGQEIMYFVEHNQFVCNLVQKCGGRCHVVDNKYWTENPKDEKRSNQFQVEKLLKTIEKMVEDNNGSCYTDEMLQEAQKKIREQANESMFSKCKKIMYDTKHKVGRGLSSLSSAASEWMETSVPHIKTGGKEETPAGREEPVTATEAEENGDHSVQVEQNEASDTKIKQS